MRIICVVLLLTACAGTADAPAASCVPGTGPPSWLAGNWHAPDPPSDFTIDLRLAGDATALCGDAIEAFVVDAGPPVPVSGNEQRLRFLYSTSRYEFDVVRESADHFLLLIPDAGRAGYRFVRR